MFVAAAADVAVFVAAEMFALPCCLLLPLLVTRPSAACAGPCNVMLLLFVLLFSSGDSTTMVKALHSGRSPHGGGQRHVLVLQCRSPYQLLTTSY